MVSVILFSHNSCLVGFQLKGHANCGAYGEDLVCASISSVAQTAILGITDVLKLDADITLQNGNCVCILKETTSDSDRERVDIVIRTMLCGLQSIASSNPKALKFLHREV